MPAMVRALDFAGYDFNYTFTKNANHWDENVSVIFPEVLRFLWKDYPHNDPAPKAKTRNAMLQQILVERKGFELVKSGVSASSRLLSNYKSDVLLTSATGTLSLKGDVDKMKGLPDKILLSIAESGNWLTYDTVSNQICIIRNGKQIQVLHEKMYPLDAVALRDGGFYILGAAGRIKNVPVLWYLSPENKLTIKDTNLQHVRAIGLSNNNNWLYPFDYDTRRGYSYKVDKHSKDVLYKQEFFYIHLPDDCDGAETTAVICDDYGRTYLATTLGVQVCDYNGRSEGILSLPANARPISIAWGGTGLNCLYVLCNNGCIYKRDLNTKGYDPSGKMPSIRVGAG